MASVVGVTPALARAELFKLAVDPPGMLTRRVLYLRHALALPVTTASSLRVRTGGTVTGQGPGLVNVLSQREWLRVDQFQYTHG